MREPKFRSGISKAINELAQELKLPNRPDMQDWSYQVANPKDVKRYIDHYRLTSEEEKKFVLMEIIIQAANDHGSKIDFAIFSEQIREILMDDFLIHEYTIFYWSCFDNENLADTWAITPLMREIWTIKKG